MNEQKIMRFLFLAVSVLLLLSIFWHLFAPFLSLALLYLMLLVIRSGFVQTLLGKRREPPVYYQPPQQPREGYSLFQWWIIPPLFSYWLGCLLNLMYSSKEVSHSSSFKQRGPV